MNTIRSYEHTKLHYHQLRKLVYQYTINRFENLPLELTEISAQHVIVADQWNATKQPLDRSIPWSWQRMFDFYNLGKEIKRFDLAVTINRSLCALCYGLPSSGKWQLKIHVLQGDINININPLKGKALEIILFSATLYAELLGSKELWICNPLNDSLTNLYVTNGFVHHVDEHDKTTHLMRKIS